MTEDIVAEVKRIHGRTKRGRTRAKDPTMTGGERSETPEQKREREAKKNQPREAPIIQKDVT